MKYRALYKCRLCGEIHTEAGFSLTWGEVHRTLMSAQGDTPNANIHLPEVVNAAPAHLIELHECSSRQIGISDFVGVRCIEDD